MFHVSDRLQVLLSNLAAQVMRIGAMLFLARLLPPAVHGQVALVASFVGIFSSFGDFGLRRFLVQNRDWPEEEVRDTLFVLLFGMGLIQLVISLACGWYLAHTYLDNRLFWIAAALGTTAALSAVYDTQLGLMSRRLAFASETRQQLIFAFAQAASGIAYAFAGLGVFALALQPFTAQLIGNFTILRYQPPFWPRKFRREIAKACVKPGLQMGLAFYFAAVSTPIHNLLFYQRIGKSDAMLGLFQKLIQLRELVTFDFVYRAFDRLIFPLFSQGQHDPVRLRDLFLRFSAMVTIFVGMCGWGLVTTSPELVRVAFGSQWDAVNDPNYIRALCLPLLITTGTGAVSLFLCSALNRPYVWAVHSIAVVVLSFVAAAVSMGGAVGLILGFSAAQIVASIYVIHWALKTLQIPVAVLLRRLLMPVLIGVLSGATTLAIKSSLFAAGPPWQRLLGTGALITLLFCMLAWVMDRETVSELRRLIRRKQKLKPKAEET